MIIDDVLRAVLLYMRLVSYPAGIFGLLWLMLWRHDWRTRPTSLIYLSNAMLLASQFSVVIIRIVDGEEAVAAASDVFITPALIVFNLSLWTGILWLSRRWRRDTAEMV